MHHVNDPVRERVTVLVWNQGKHLFETIRDPRIALVSEEDTRSPDLIVLPCGQDRRFEQLSTITLPDWIRTRVADGSCGVVLDASPEAIPPKADINRSLHEVIARLGLVPQQCVYITANWYFERDYLSYCETAGIAAPVRVLHYDYWIWDSVARLANHGERVYAHRLAAFRSRPPVRPRRFISLNRTPRPFKIVFLLSVMRDHLWNAGFISFGGFRKGDGPGKPRPTANQLANALPGFEDLIAQLEPHLDALDDYGCVLLGLERPGLAPLKQKTATEARELPEYHESWFSAVTETEMLQRPSRITEKVLKPLLNFHPLVLLGNPGSLQRVREYGFATFDDIIDESYDQETDPRRRFDAAYTEFTRLCLLGNDELHALEKRTTDRLVFNARWGLTRFPTVYRAQRDVALVNDILAAVRRQPRERHS
jgi:hypothetical protein